MCPFKKHPHRGLTPFGGWDNFLDYLAERDADIDETIKRTLSGELDGVDEYVDKQGNIVNGERERPGRGL